MKYWWYLEKKSKNFQIIESSGIPIHFSRVNEKDFEKIWVNRFGKKQLTVHHSLYLSWCDWILFHFVRRKENFIWPVWVWTSWLFKKEWQYLLFKQNKNKNKLNRSKQNLQKYVEHAKEKKSLYLHVLSFIVDFSTQYCIYLWVHQIKIIEWCKTKERRIGKRLWLKRW